MGQQSLEEGFVDHPRIHDEALEARTYQEVVAAGASEENTIVVLPTGLGKTAVAILMAAHRLEERPNAKILMLAPTRPLVEQHRDEFERCLKVDTDIFEVLTGDTRPAKREEAWKEVGAFFATPQVVENDIINDRIDLDEFALVVFDEVHRATGDYPYTFIAEQYAKHPDHHILGLSASPGGDREKIEQVADNLSVDNFEIRTEDDPDVKPYIKEKRTHWKKVELGQHFERVKKQLEDAERTYLKKLQKLDLLDSRNNVTKKDLLQLRGKIGKRMNTEDDPDLYQGMSHVAACMKVEHALELLETQGVKPLYQFFEKMKKDQSTKAAQRLLNDESFQNAMAVTEWMVNNGKEHPKMESLQDLLREQLTEGENAIVFTQYRDTVDLLHDRLGMVSHLEPVKFKGQKDGFTQQKQMDILDDFRAGAYNVLVSTSVGEEGLDIPAVDYVIFYEPIPSEIRTIQRKGRTGRQEHGDIYVFMAKDTRDEAYYWSAKHKEDNMKQVMKELDDRKNDEKDGTVTVSDGKQSDVADASDTGNSADDTSSDSGGQSTLDGFSDEDALIIYADDRENTIMKQLTRRDVTVRSTRLEVGDFLVSDRAAVERKAADDFVSSLIDNRLFDQMNMMRQEFDRPALIIEGSDLYKHRDVHPNAIRGALASIVLDYDIPIIWSDDEGETAELLIALAKREQEDNERSVSIRGEKPGKTEQDLQQFIVAGLPNVSETLADRLLEEFGSVAAVFNASEAALKDVEGIGDEKAKRIRDILDREYEA